MRKMTNRQNMVDALEGRRPEMIPYTLYGGVLSDEADRIGLFDMGLCHLPRVTIVKENMQGVEQVIEKQNIDNYSIVKTTLKTPVGEVTQITRNFWTQEYFLKTPGDYSVIKYIVENTKLELDNEIFLDSEKKIGGKGMTLVRATRTPYQRICVDYAGLENFGYHLADAESEVSGLMEVIEEKVLEYYRLIASSPAKFIQMPENLTSEQSGPVRYKKYHLPVLKKITAMMHQSGKKIVAHCDGKVSCISHLIAESGLDGIESFTLPPEGDMSMEQARSVWPDKVIWNNIRVSDYQLPPQELKNIVRESIIKGSVDGRLFLFDISEDRPGNWRDSFRVVLDAIKEYNGL